MCIIFYVFFFNYSATTETHTYLHPLSLHDALPIFAVDRPAGAAFSSVMEMPQASAAADRRADLRGQVIVVLEDDDLVRRATERLLRRCGAEVVAARSSGEALASLAAPIGRAHV